MARSVWYAAIMFVEYWKKEIPPNTVYYKVFKDFNLWRNANTFDSRGDLHETIGRKSYGIMERK